MTWWQRLWGPSTTDRLLDMLVQQQAAQAALMQTWAETLAAQQALSATQMDLLTAPTEPPRVRLMTRATEAQYEQQRAAAKATAGTTAVDPQQFMAEMTQYFTEVQA